MRYTQSVTSTAINQVSYDDETKILTIRFNHGAEYDYPDIPQEEYFNLVSAPSVGRYYNQHIKLKAAAFAT